MSDRLGAAMAALPAVYAGPGGAAAVLRNGTVLASHSWGWADAAARLPFTDATPFPICSITKQFTCAVVRDAFGDPARLDGAIAAAMPRLATPVPALRLCHNQSGLRDYWATAMLSGATPEDRFTDADARALVARTASLQFAPGTRSSYCNQNFRMLSDAAEAVSGQPFARLLAERVFAPAGMAGAALSPDTAALPGGIAGYEGSVDAGFRPAVNRIHWTGDAGISAGLADMIAWERFIDRTRDDPDGLYTRLTAPVSFADGTPASYGFGLGRLPVLGRAAFGHGGGLRGFRSRRFYLPAERLSVVVLFNHMADAGAAALDLARAALDDPAPPAPDGEPWEGRFLEPETGLLARVEPAGAHQIRLWFGQGPELLPATGGDTLQRDGGTVRMLRPAENLRSSLVPLPEGATAAPEGRFECAELESALTIATAGGVAYGAFSGPLGQGEMGALIPAAPDVWRLPCPRALDFAPPGDWTVRRMTDGSLKVGCWLARDLVFAAA